MDYSTSYSPHAEAIAALFTATFTVSDSAEEGALVGGLVRRLIAETPAEDLRVVTAWEDGTLVGGLFFTRLIYPNDAHRVFLMAPVAVATVPPEKRMR